jgi:hypothetical protein
MCDVIKQNSQELSKSHNTTWHQFKGSTGWWACIYGGTVSLFIKELHFARNLQQTLRKSVLLFRIMQLDFTI